MLPPSPGFWFHLHLYSGQKCAEPFGFKAHLSPGGWIQHGTGEKWQCREGAEAQPLPHPGAPGVEMETFLRLTHRWIPACAIPLGFLQLPAGRAEPRWAGCSGNWEQTKNAFLKAFPERIGENSRFKSDTILLEDPAILANTLFNNIVKIAVPAFHISCGMGRKRNLKAAGTSSSCWEAGLGESWWLSFDSKLSLFFFFF